MKHGRAHKKAPEAAYYDRIFRTHEQFHRHYSRSRYLPLWQEIAKSLPPDANILEVGCGTGQLAALLFDEGFRRYRGFDFSESAVVRARASVPDFDFEVADARKLSSFEGQYDTVVATEVLEHLDDDLGMIRMLPPGTSLHFTLPCKDDPSHVRYFPHVKGAEARYANVLEDLSVRTLAQWHIGLGVVKGAEP